MEHKVARSGRGIVRAAMFTGIVREVGRVEAVEEGGEAVRLVVSAPETAADTAIGDSIALGGVCLTAVAVEDGTVAFEAVPETLRRSSLGPLDAGDEVNIELPLRASDRLGGHVVQGHVDGTGTVEEMREEGFSRVVRIATPPDLLRYVVEKGSIAVDGVSLTVARVDDRTLDVSLIPETLERTTLGSAEPGRTVNLEVDIVAKYVEKLVGAVR